jgi:hypothetical protein
MDLIQLGDLPARRSYAFVLPSGTTTEMDKPPTADSDIAINDQGDEGTWSVTIYRAWLTEDEPESIMGNRYSSATLEAERAQIASEFRRLRDDWKRRTSHLSSLTQKFADPAYLQIVAMGEKALPFIFGEIRRQPDHWFAALFAISGGQEVIRDEHRGNLTLMTADWLEWAEQHGIKLA